MWVRAKLKSRAPILWCTVKVRDGKYENLGLS